MCTCKNSDKSPLFKKYLQAGYVHCFEFIEGMVVSCCDRTKRYPIWALRPLPKPCTVGEIIIYTFCVPEGLLGHAVLCFYHNQELY